MGQGQRVKVFFVSTSLRTTLSALIGAPLARQLGQV